MRISDWSSDVCSSDLIVALVERVYADRMSGYSRDMIRAQINNYPEGQFVALYEGTIVGYCASMRLDERLALSPHGWEEITNDGFGSRHDPTGDWLYGYETFVDPEARGVRNGQPLYAARKALAERLELQGIVFGARMPAYARHRPRSGGRRLGKEWVSTVRSWWAPFSK